MNAIKHPALILAMSVALLLPVTTVYAQHDQHGSIVASGALPTAAEAGAGLRDLWIGHVFWVRNVVVATVAANDKAAAESEKQVVANARAIANAIEPYYGKEASDKLFGLLAEHYGAIKKILEATVAGSREDAQILALNDNASKIAKFLSGANPNLPYDTLNGLLVAHGAHHVRQIEQLHGKDYGAEAATWEAMKNHMYVIADALAGGIAKQFPEKFR